MPGYAFAQSANSVFVLTLADNINSSSAGSPLLDGATDIAIFESGGSRYAAVTAPRDHAVQILNITDPASITVSGNITQTGFHFLDGNALSGARSIDVYESGDSRYAAVTAYDINAVQILDITDPASITEAGQFLGFASIDGPNDIAVFESRGSRYAAVTAVGNDAVQILNITDPASITAAGNITGTDSPKLDGAWNIAIYESKGSRYAAVTASQDDAVQILNITDPYMITPAGSIADDNSFGFEMPRDIAVFESGGSHYAVVAVSTDSAVQILNITDPDMITTAGRSSNNANLKLDGPRDIAVFESGGSRYAAVTTHRDDAVQILDITDPPTITPAGSIANATNLDGARGIAVFESGGSHYAVVAAYTSSTVQIVRITERPPEGSFVTTWKTTAPSESITIPVDGATGNYTVHWGDGSITTHVTDATHTYDAAGSHTVSISGDFTKIYLTGDQTNAEKLASIDQWGDMEWTTMEGAFSRAGNMVYRATDAPNLSGVSSMKNMFYFARSFTGNLSEWDVSSVTDMESMFSSASAFNGDISGWDVSSVTTMKGMFVAANKFNGDISGWNVSSVTDMFTMFAHASEFNQDISGWNVSSVTDMTQMLTGANGFSQNLGKWYITLDSTSVDLASDTTVGTILPQNGWLADNQIGAYGIAETHDHGFFEINGTSLNVKDGADYTGKTDYVVSITSTHPFGTGNQRLVGVTVTDSSSAFVTTWEVETSPYVIHMPVEIHTGATATIDWGDDSTTDVSVNGTQQHTYAAAGNYTVAVTGGLGRINLAADSASADKLKSIDQWGDIEWTTMEEMFWSASNMVYNATDAPDLSSVTSMELMFNSASEFNGDLSSWNVSGVTQMSSMFNGASEFNGDLSSWNVSSVTDMRGMFRGALAFNGDLSSWNVSGVTQMSNMFNGASEFNGDLSSWNVSGVTQMSSMFDGASEFNGDLSSWNVSGVTQMSSMFNGASEFNGDLSSWNVSSVTHMNGMFLDASAFNGDLSSWNVSGVTDMYHMFLGASEFNGDLSSWNVSGVTDMESMFQSAASFNQDISGWDVSSVRFMNDMFTDATNFDQNLGEWYVVLNSTEIDAGDAPGIVGTISTQNQFLRGQNPTYGIGAGEDSGSFNVTGGSDLNMTVTPDKSTYTVNITSTGSFGTNNHRLVNVTVTDTSTAFKTTWNTATPNEDITIPATGSYDIDWGDGTAESVTGPKTHTYADAGSHAVTVSGGLTRINLGADPDNAAKLASIDQWGDMEWTTMEGAFHGASNMAYDAADTPDLSGVASMNSMFRDTSFSANLSGWNVSSVTDTGRVFQGSSFNGDISGWDVSRVQGMRSMFSGASSFNQPLDTWNVSSATNMAFMFYDAYRFNQDLGSWTVSSVDTMEYMFGSSAVHSAFNGSISTWDVSQVTNMEGMFGRASSFNGDLSGWDVSSVTDMESMFLIASSFDQPLNDWNVSRVQSMRSMFSEASSFDQPLNDWNVSSVTDMEGMFRNAASFNQPLGTWNVSLVANMDSMFSQANDFDQNLGEWYVVLNSTSINAADAPGVVGGISAQNRYLNGQTPTYAIGTGGDSGSFNITGGSNLNMNITSPAKSPYAVNITSAGGFDFSNHRVYNVTVTDLDTTPTPPPKDAFVTTWEVETSPYVIHMPVEIRSGATATIDWGDGNSTTVSIDGTQQHTYADAGNYTVAVTGGLGRINLAADSASADKLKSIDQWGSITWTTMEGAFQGAYNMAYRAADAPDLSGVTNMTGMFSGASAFDGNLSGWDVSGVTDMAGMFQFASDFNGNVSGWDVSGVTDMAGMFQFASDFNGNVSGWDVSGVTDMRDMFSGAAAFNGNVSGWDVSGVTDMANMFGSASDFNSDLSGWDVSRVTDMYGMFWGAAKFDSDLSGWNASGVTDMTNMFQSASAFNGNVSGWDVSGVTDMSSMFQSASAFNGNVSGWDVSSVDNMNRMFFDAAAFSQDISGWNVSGVTDMFGMFYNAAAFNADLSGWNVSGVTDMTSMFQGAASFQQNLGEWHVVLDSTSVDLADSTTIGTISPQNAWLANEGGAYGIGMGHDSDLFRIDGASLKVEENTDYTARTDYAVNITSTYPWGTNNHLLVDVTVSNSSHVPRPFVTTWETIFPGETITIELGGTHEYTVDWGDGIVNASLTGFQDHTYTGSGNYSVAISGDSGSITFSRGSQSSLKIVSLDQWGDIRWDTMNGMFWQIPNMAYNATDRPNLSGVTNMANMFNGATSFDGNLSGWDVSSVTNMANMFNGATSFDGNLSGWDVSSVTNMANMFNGATSFDGDLSDWNPSSVTNMNNMFKDAAMFNGNVSDWNPSSVTNMANMFRGASAFDGNLSGWDVSRVKFMQAMFSGATSFDGDLSDWNASSAISMKNMFLDAAMFNGNVSGWNPSSVINMEGMFNDAAKFNGNLSGWDVSSVTKMKNMFSGAAKFNGDLSGWNTSSATNMETMFLGAAKFNGNISGWNVSSVTDMDNMFLLANSFQQNLGNWYVVPADTHYGNAEASLNVTTVAAQNSELDDQNPDYGIGDGHDFDSFNMTGSTLFFKSAPSALAYKVNITATGLSDFGTNNHRILDITVDGADPNMNPVLGDIAPRSVDELVLLEFNATASDDDAGDILTFSLAGTVPVGASMGGNTGAFSWMPGEAQDGNHTVTVRVSDGRGGGHSRDVQIEVREVNLPPELAVATAHEATELEPLEFSATATDPDTVGAEQAPNDLTFSLAGTVPVGASIDPDTGAFFWIPGADQGGTHVITVRVSDGEATDSEDVTVTVADSATAFVTTWKADTSPDTVSIPVSVHSGGTVTIHWGDGSNSTVSGNGLQTHTYQDSGQYQVAMTGDLSRIIMGDLGSTPGQLLSIDQWGNGTWGSMQNAFKEAVNMEYKATDAPDLSRVTNMEDMFYDASSFNGSLSSWNVSSVTRMNYMFSGASSFNGSLSGWNVSSVTGMGGMFRNAASFNQPLNDWNVSSVTGMEHMFSRASSFNQPLNGWNVSSVTSTEHMFSAASSFNQSLSDWDVSSVTGMTGMFNLASSFDRPLSDWDVSSVTSTEHMFNEASSFNRPLNGWNVSSVTGMDSMFRDATAFNGSLSGWNVSSVNRMDSMFAGASSFNGNISSWDVSSVTRMNGMFNLASSFNGNISSWNVSSVSFMLLMFNGTDSFDQNLGEWYVTLDSASIVRSGGPGVVGTISAQNQFLRDQNATYGIGAGGDFGLFAIHDSNRLNMTSFGAKSSYVVNVTASGSGVFEDGNNWHALEVTLAGEAVPPEGAFVTTWRTNSTGQSITIPVGNATGSYTVDWGDGSITTHTADATHTYADAGNHTVSISGDFTRIRLDGHADASKLVSIDRWGDARWESMERAFRGASDMEYGATDAPDLSGVTNMTGMFEDASSFDGNLSGWNVSSVTAMNSMFERASSFNGSLSGWNVSSVTDMNSMFLVASSFNQPLNDWNVSSVTDMNSMFAEAYSFDQPLNDWNVSSVTAMDGMFFATPFNQPLNDWDVSSVTGMLYMFAGIFSFNQPLNDWNVSSVTRMDGMFSGAFSFDQPLNDWDVSSVTGMEHMFTAASSFNQSLNGWDVSSATNMTGMFEDASSFDQPLNDWNVSSVTGMDHMFSGASSFNRPLNDWNVSSVTGMDGMFSQASDFSQNLGDWYIVLNGTSINAADAPGVVGSISAQNQYLNDQTPTYAIGAGGDSGSFNITGGSNLNMNITSPAKSPYAVNITSAGGFDFSNHRVYNVTVTGFDTNSPPEVGAGDDQEVAEGATVTLSGTVSDDDLGDILTYLWTHDGDPAITITGSDSLSASFVAPNVAANTTVTVTLTVNDGTVDVSDALQVNITDSPNSQPKVEAGADQEVVEGATVNLSGTVSDDDPEDAPTYEWTHDGALAITFANSSALSTTFAAPNVAANTTVTVTLTVNDGTVDVSDALQVNITDSPNSQPKVEAGADQEVVEGATVNLSGTVSDDDPEDAPTYEWTHDGALAITFANSSALSTTFAAPDVAANTTVTVTLTADDGTVEVSDALQVNITDSSNSPPTVNAGQDQEVVEGATVTLSGTATDDDPGDTLTYSWTHDSSLAITFANSSAPSTTFAAPDVAADTTITVTLTVNDGTVDVSDALQVTITDSAVIQPSTNSLPTVDVGGDRTVSEGEPVSLSWSASDADGDPLTYTWSQSPPAPAITFASPNSSPTTFTAPRVNSNTLFTLTLTANDGTGDGADSLHLTVRDSSGGSGSGSGSRSSGGGGGGSSTRSQAPALDFGALVSSGLVSIPQDIAQLLRTFDPDEPIPPVNATGPLDAPLVINGSAYLLGGVRNTLEPQTIRPGEPVSIIFTVYSRADIEHFTVYMNLQGADPRLSDSDTHIRFNKGTVSTVDPNGFIAGANVTITQDPSVTHKYRVQVDVEFAKEMGQTDMIVRLWNTRSASVSVYVINAFEVLAPAAAQAEPDLPPGQEIPDPRTAALRMWAGFDSVTIGDAGLIAALGLDYPDAVIPAWVRTGLAPLVINNGIAVDEFTTALRYVLENIGSRGATNDAAGSQPADPDAAAPTVTSVERSDPVAETTSAQTLVFAVTFSGDVTGVDAGDFELSPDSGGGPGQFAQTSTPALAIPDDAPAVSDAITVPGPGTATSVSVSVDIAHPFTGDLMVEIVAPDGTARTLHRYSGEGTDDIVRMYAPDFGGTGIAGDWTLRVSDGAPGDAGTLNGWTLIVGHDGAGGSVTGLAGSGSQYLVTVSAPREGTYNLDVIRDSGIADAAGNPLAGAAPTGADHTYTVVADTTAPTVTSIERSSPAAASTSSRTLVFAVTFGEDVTGVDAGDFALSPDSTGGGSGPGQFTHTRTPWLAIPDNAAAVSDAITVPGSGTATSVSVSVNIAHPYIDDLTVELVAPDGTARTLHSRSGGLANDIVRTYTPDFAGTGIAGDWILRIGDGARGDAGTLNGWTLTVNHGGADSPVTGLAGSGSQYLVTVSAAREGTYNLDVIRDSGIADAAGNPLADAAPTGVDHTYTRTGP